jgi:hypothetical protein
MIAFGFAVSFDVVDEINSGSPSLEEKSKLCLVEFSQKKCDSLNLTTPCQSLMSCIQKNDEKDMWEKIRRAFSLIYS